MEEEKILEVEGLNNVNVDEKPSPELEENNYDEDLTNLDINHLQTPIKYNSDNEEDNKISVKIFDLQSNSKSKPKMNGIYFRFNIKIKQILRVSLMIRQLI